MRCPTCQKDLVNEIDEFGKNFHCGSCSGEFYHVNVLRKMDIDFTLIKEILYKTQNSPNQKGRACPKCQKKMNLIYPSNPQVNFSVEFCSHDRSIWLDKNKLHALPHNPLKKQPDLSEKSIKALKLIEIEQNSQIHNLSNLAATGNKIRFYLISFIPGAIIGILLAFWFISKQKILVFSVIFPLVFVSAFILGCATLFAYSTLSKVR